MFSFAEIFARVFSIGQDILATTVNATTGVVLFQLGDSTKAVPDTDKAEGWGPIGQVGTPLPPTQGNSSCQVIAVRHSDHDLVIATRDTRNSSINADLDPGGESALYAPAGSATNGRVVCRKNGKIQLLSTQEIDLGSISPGDALGLASKIDQAVSTIVGAFNAHVHNVTALASPTGPPIPPGAPIPGAPIPITPAPGSVASSLVKVAS